MRHRIKKWAALAWGVLTAAVALQAAIIIVPSQPNVEQPVTLTVTDSLVIESSQGVSWDFGDGSTFVGLSVTGTHTYLSSGMFIVRVSYMARPATGGGALIPRTGQAQVMVSEKRTVTFSPPNPVADQPVTFQALNFLAQLARWDFGDGSALQTSGLSVTHTYRRPGAFIVSALDYAGDSRFPIQASVMVKAAEVIGPRAAFKISFLQLRFDDGKSYKVVPENAPGLKAFVDMKFEGSGILSFEWLMDGAIFRQETRALTFARDMTFDSGPSPELPTQIPGLHSISLRVISPQSELAMPVIRYFVMTGAAAPSVAARVVIELTATVSLTGQTTPLTGPSLELPSGGYGLLKGQLRNESRSPIAVGLLRVSRGTRVSDLQIVRNIGPGETRTFLTSIYQPPATDEKRPQTAFISFYDLSSKPPLLLVAKKIPLADIP
jgi:hypothetical protein